MKVIAIVSGGMDSAVLLWQLLEDGHDVSVLTFDYGQRHLREIRSAEQLARQAFGASFSASTFKVVKLRLPGASALQDSTVPVPDGHYEDESMKATVVPGRNLVMLSTALAHAAVDRAEAVAYAAHGGDHAIYPDCREPFADAMRAVAAAFDYRPVKLLSPFMLLSKRHVAQLGRALGVPFELTWSCYRGREFHCGTCGTCVERKEALFTFDPTTYEDRLS